MLLSTLLIQLPLVFAAKTTSSAQPKYGTGPGQIDQNLEGQIIDHNAYQNAGVDMQNDPAYKAVRSTLKTMAKDNRDGIMTVRDDMLSIIDKYFSTVSGFYFYTSINTAWLVPGFDIHTLTTQFSDDPLPTATSTTESSSSVCTSTGTKGCTTQVSTSYAWRGHAQTAAPPNALNKKHNGGGRVGVEKAVLAVVIPALLI